MESTPVGKNTLNAKILPLGSTPVGAKTTDPETLILPAELSKRKEKSLKEYAPEDSESDPDLSDSSSIEYDLSNNSKYRKSKIKLCNKKKKNRKGKKWDSSDSSLSDSDSSD